MYGTAFEERAETVVAREIAKRLSFKRRSSPGKRDGETIKL